MPKRGEMFCPSPEECPPAVTRLIQECMRRNPRDRPSAREIYRHVPHQAGQTLFDRVQAHKACMQMDSVIEGREVVGCSRQP